MVELHNLPTQPLLRKHGIDSGFQLLFDLLNLIGMQGGSVVIIVHNQLIRNGHHLAKFLLRRIKDSNVIIHGFAHLIHTISSHQNGRKHCNLLFLTKIALHVASCQDIEFLFRGTQLNIALDSNRIIALQDRIHDLMHAQG